MIVDGKRVRGLEERGKEYEILFWLILCAQMRSARYGTQNCAYAMVRRTLTAFSPSRCRWGALQPQGKHLCAIYGAVRVAWIAMLLVLSNC